MINKKMNIFCNFDLEFIYVLSGWERSAHNSKVLSDALSRRNELKVPQSPFRGVRYHLQDFNCQGHHPENANELFNLCHASLRNLIESIFGIFKLQFTIFKTVHPFPYKTQAELVLVCAGLHNFLRKECRSDEFPVEPNNEDSSSPLSYQDDDFEPFFETQEQQRENTNEWRATIARNMWDNVGDIDNNMD
ncbi:hypothetical protein ACOSP7_022001 [Xanthoceras sorbifolium]